MGQLQDLRDRMVDLEQWYQHYLTAKPAAWTKQHFTAADYIIEETANLVDELAILQKDVAAAKQLNLKVCLDAWRASVNDRDGVER